MQKRLRLGHLWAGIAAVLLLGVVAIPVAQAATPTNLYVADQFAAGGNGAVLVVNPTNGTSSTLASGGSIHHPTDVAVDGAGQLIVAQFGIFGSADGSVLKVNPATHAQSLLTSGNLLTNPRGLAIAADGTIFVADEYAGGGTGAIIKVDPVTHAQSLVTSGANLNHPWGIAIDQGGQLLVTQFGIFGGPSGSLVRVDPATHTQMVLSSNGSFANPSGVVVVPGGDIYVADQYATGNGAVIKINPLTGTQTIVAQGGNLLHPSGITLDPNGELDVSQFGIFGSANGTVVKVNPAGGAQTLLATGGSLANPRGLTNAPAATTNLAVVKTGPATANAGDQVTYQVKVTNTGSLDAQAVTLSDTLPTGTTFVSETQASGPSFGCTSPPVGGTGMIACTIATLPAGASATFVFVVKIDANVQGGTSISNTATVSTTTPESDTTNNSSTTTVLVGSSGNPGGGGNPGATPELDTLLLVTAGMAGLLGYGRTRLRRRSTRGS